MTLREAAEQALESMEAATGYMTDAQYVRLNQSIDALRAALAEPDGWRQCAVGQRTTQYCGLLEETIKAEREACAEIMERNAQVCNNQSMLYEALMAGAAAIRARGNDE